MPIRFKIIKSYKKKPIRFKIIKSYKKKQTTLLFEFPCPFLWEEILKYKQIAEQRDHKTQLMKIMPGHSKNAHKLGFVPNLNRRITIDIIYNKIRGSMGTPQFSNWDPYYPYRTIINNLQDEMRRNYNTDFYDCWYIEGDEPTLFFEADKQLDYCEETGKYLQNKKISR